MWRLSSPDTDGDDNFDKLVKLKSLGDTAGEHGPHAIIPAPDGKHLYVIIGNQTKVPADYTHSRVPEVWGEDQLLPSLQHFMKGAEAPLGHIAQIDPEGKTWEIVATGFRNQYDAAFNREGELFTYDADMEWDLNTPWYRPTRINHVIDGADYDGEPVLGSLWISAQTLSEPWLTIDPGSPTGVCFGYGAKFPAKYQNAFLPVIGLRKALCRHLKPESPLIPQPLKSLPPPSPYPSRTCSLTLTMGPCFTVGGRRVQSGLIEDLHRQRIHCASAICPRRQIRRQDRHSLEVHLQRDAAAASASELDHIWASLGSVDRGIRHAARAALEKQKVGNWKGRIKGEKNPVIITAALIALARVDATNSAVEILKKAMSINYRKPAPTRHASTYCAALPWH